MSDTDAETAGAFKGKLFSAVPAVVIDIDTTSFHRAFLLFGGHAH